MFLLLFSISLILIYLYTTRNHNYWKERDVRHDMPLPLFGNHLSNVFGIKNITAITSELYKKYQNEKVVGYFTGVTPELIVRDPEIIRNVLITHFDHFYPRVSVGDAEKDPLINNLLFAQGDLWKLLRRNLTPAFTKAKLKAMFPYVLPCVEKLHGLGNEIVEQGGECDVRDLITRFTLEFLGACGFGIDIDVISYENTLFRKLENKVFNRMGYRFYLFELLEILPEVRKYFWLFDKKTETVFANAFKEILKKRNFKPGGRNDFLDLLLTLASKGSITGKSMEYKNHDGSPKEVEIKMGTNYLVSQIFAFLAAGVETSTTTISNTLHELAFHPEIQYKIQNQIDEVLAKFNNKLCYDAITEMSLLEMAFKETLRLYPAIGTLHRICAKRYTIPQLNITIDPGVKIMIPVQALHADEQYFEKPDEFRPQRFIQKTGNKQENCVYLPFGEGPRTCIGARLAQMQSLAAIAAILQKFTVEPSERTQRKLKITNSFNIVQRAENGVPLRLKLRTK